jgi:hypothetical protein
MKRSALRLLALAVPTVLVSAFGLSSASALVADPGHTGIDLWTSITFSGDTLIVTADGEFRTTFVENTTIALQVVGTETWTDATGSHSRALTASPTSVAFAKTNHVGAAFSLHHDSIVELSYTAEDAGLAPTPFSGSCYGAGTRTSSANSLTTKDC